MAGLDLSLVRVAGLNPLNFKNMFGLLKISQGK